MRRLILTAVAAIAIACVGSLAGTRAEAMPLAGIGSLSENLGASTLTEQVRLVCTRVWNGYRWTRSCYETRRPHYAPRHHYRGRHGHHHSPRGHHHGHRRGHR